MIEGASIICFAHDWDSDPTSKTHIMRILSEKNRILWINSIGMRRPMPSRHDARRLVKKFKTGLQGCIRIHENFYVYNPLVLPFPGVQGVDALNTWILSASIRHHARRLRLKQPLLWTFLPNVNGLVGRLGERMVIYHCVDEYSAFSGVPREALQQMEQELLRKADLVFTSSEDLCRERQAYNPRTFFVPHGVDLDHFSRALDPQTPIPADILEIKRPIVGFFGLIADWVDPSLIRHVARARPHWSIVLVGKATTDLTPLKGLPNVFLLGQRPYRTLPAYSKAFDVGIIPFRINKLTLKANPLKLREYLAAGLPVVSTPLPEVAKYAGLVRVAEGGDEFVGEIAQGLEERGEPFVKTRLAAMQRESWDSRVEELSSYISDRLSVRNVKGGVIPEGFEEVESQTVTAERDNQKGGSDVE